MMQVIYGWQGVPAGTTNGEDGYRWVHVPQERYHNRYEPVTNPGGYEGEVHENVDVTEVTTIIRRNGRVMNESTRAFLWCRDCGAESNG